MIMTDGLGRVRGTSRAARRAYDRGYASDGKARERRYAKVHRGYMHYHITTSPSTPSFPSQLTILTLFSLIDTPTFVIRDRPSTILGSTLHFFDSSLDSQFCSFFL